MYRPHVAAATPEAHRLETVEAPSAMAALPERPEPTAHKLWLSVYVVVLLGKFADWVPGLAGLPIAKVAILFAAVFAWRARASLAAVRVRSQPIARVALAFLALAIVSVLFSVYPSMSLNHIYLIVVLVTSFVLVVKVTETLHDVSRLLLALCLAAGGLTMAALYSFVGGRASVGENIDPNDLAYGLVTAIPICRALVMTRRKLRWVLQGASLAMVVAILLTASRGGTLGLCMVILLITAFPLNFDKTGQLKPFRFGRMLVVLSLVAVLGAGLWNHLPGQTQERLATLLDLEHDYNAGTTQSSRSAMWMRNSKAVLSRPVGFGFATSEYVDGLTGGQYRALHNSFVQAFVELGFLGLVLFCSSYLVTARQLGRVSALGRQAEPGGDRAKAALYARALRIALAGNVVSGFFLSDAYSELLWTVIAISAALVRISRPGEANAGTAQAQFNG